MTLHAAGVKLMIIVNKVYVIIMINYRVTVDDMVILFALPMNRKLTKRFSFPRKKTKVNTIVAGNSRNDNHSA